MANTSKRTPVEESFNQAVLEHSKKDIEEFFRVNFEVPLQHKLLRDVETPAEWIRQQLIQTEIIKTLFLTLDRK